jgi:hypothetical protein
MRPPGESSRPPAAKTGGAGHHNATALSLTDEARADLVLRCAWLTVHADRFSEIGGGLLSAQLLDLRDLLEGGAVKGWPR